ncbi:MAG: NAD-dependent epimerase/dehydratase family protein [Chromatiales bacterium]|nr:NAD-dependent epimerase/dehydratase family protein [Chromatiales bacterium]
MRNATSSLIGGSGFVGSHIAHLLCDAAAAACSCPRAGATSAKHLILLPTCDVVEADVHDDATLDRLVAGQHAVINLVGILHGTRARPDFARAHVDADAADRRRLPKRRRAPLPAHERARRRSPTARRCTSAARATPRQAVRDCASSPGRSSSRRSSSAPSDRFLNMFAKLAAIAPVLPLGGAERPLPAGVGRGRRRTPSSTASTTPPPSARPTSCAGPKVYTLRATGASSSPRPVGTPRG